MLCALKIRVYSPSAHFIAASGVSRRIARANMFGITKVELISSMPPWNGPCHPEQYVATKQATHCSGWQGPFHGGIEEINSTFVMPNMFARAIRGETPEAAMKWAEGEYTRIFKAHNIG